MKATISLTLVVLFTFATASDVSAQNLFRTGRPSYLRQPQSTDVYGYPPVNGTARLSPVVEAPWSGNVRYPDDYSRVLAAWDNYRREAARYEQRHRAQRLSDVPVRAPVYARPQVPVRQEAYDLTPYRSETCRGFDPRVPALPADRRPTLAPIDSYNRATPPSYRPLFSTPQERPISIPRDRSNPSFADNLSAWLPK